MFGAIAQLLGIGRIAARQSGATAAFYAQGPDCAKEYHAFSSMAAEELEKVLTQEFGWQWTAFEGDAEMPCIIARDRDEVRWTVWRCPRKDGIESQWAIMYPTINEVEEDDTGNRLARSLKCSVEFICVQPLCEANPVRRKRYDP